MPFRSTYRPSNNDDKDNPQALSLTGLSYKTGTVSMSAPCLSSPVVDEGDSKGYVSDSEVAKTSWSPPQADGNKSSPRTTSNFIRIGRSKSYCIKPLPTVPEGTLMTPELNNGIATQPRPTATDLTKVAACSDGDVDTVTMDTARKSLFLCYAEGDEGGMEVRTRMEENNMECMDCHRDGCYGRPEKAQIGDLMDKASWIILYISKIRCDSFDFVQQMAIEVAEEFKKKKIVNLVSSYQVRIPVELKLFPLVVVEEGDWLSLLKDIVRHEPGDFTGQRCSLKNCPLSGSSQSIQSDCVDVVRRLAELGKSGVSPQAKKYARQKQIWDAK